VDVWTWRDLRVLARAKLIILPAISSTLCSVSLSLKRVRVGMEFIWCSDLLLFRNKRSLNCMIVLSSVVVVSLCCGVRCSFRWHLVHQHVRRFPSFPSPSISKADSSSKTR